MCGSAPRVAARQRHTPVGSLAGSRGAGIACVQRLRPRADVGARARHDEPIAVGGVEHAPRARTLPLPPCPSPSPTVTPTGRGAPSGVGGLEVLVGLGLGLGSGLGLGFGLGLGLGFGLG